jgi:hypothetical protein
MLNIFKKKKKVTNNSLFTINPYYHSGMWVFDDDRVNLVKEPFVSGMPDIIESGLDKEKINNPKEGFIAIFSTTAVPGYTMELEKLNEEGGGNWYINNETNQVGWLCPALFLYYTDAPNKLYIKLKNK